ncbi:caspase family protein [Streptomyces sp. NPDC087859]|uniref:caspase family protein n=1 Tax=Streptomyces sp. NPDC087859 TaxID=3365812 RepID=UPI003811B820
MAAASPAETPVPDPARRFLIAAAVTDVSAHPDAERAELADDVRRIEELFLDELGYRRGADTGLNPTREELRAALRGFATAPDRRPDDHVVVYLAAHGVTDPDNGSHYLLLHDSRTDDLYGTALPTEDLVGQLWQGTAVERLLVLIDACYAEEGADKALRGALDARRFRVPVTEHGNTGLVLVSASRRKEEAYTGALSAAFDRAVRRHATVGHAPAHISLEQVMAAISADPEVPHAQRPVWSLAHATGDIPAFLPNPRYIPDAAGLKLEEIDRIVAVAAREKDAREQDMRGFFLPRARGTDMATEGVWDFTGRHVALGDITTWLDPRRAEERLCVVTGDPGSGKSSVLGMVAVLTHPERAAAVPRDGLPPLLPRPGDVDIRVNAGHLSTRQLLDALSAAAGCAADSLGALSAHLQTRSRPLVVLLDSLDEALAPHETVDELLAPLTDPERRLPLRLLVGARPHIADRLPADAPRVHLDSERYRDPGAVRAYARKLLAAPGSTLRRAAPRLLDAIAEAVAEAAGRSFLVARITARTLARDPHPPDPRDQEWREALPRLPGEAMERDLVQRLGPLAARARDLLLPLAYAQGAGLPWAGVWPRLASSLTDRDYGDEDVVWLRQAAGSYVVESVEAGGSVYRVYHRALIEYLREGRDAQALQRTITQTLRQVEHPYVRRYLALHAREGGVLDPLVQDAGFVLSAEPGRLLAALPGLRTREGQRAGRAVRDLEEELLGRDGRGADPQARALLRLAAVCRRADVLAASCDDGDEGLPWRARWAAWNPEQGQRRYDGVGFGLGNGVVVPREDGARFLDLARRTAVWVDLDDGGEVRAHQGAAEWYSWTLTVLPQLKEAVGALDADRHIGLENGSVRTLNYTRVLHIWQGNQRSTWMLPPVPAVDPRAEREFPDVPEQLVVLADSHGEPWAAALRMRTGHLLLYGLTTVRLHRPLTRRERGPLWKYELEDWQKRADWLTAVPEVVMSPAETGTRVTTCAAPRGLAQGILLLGRDDGLVAYFSVPLQESQGSTVTGHEGAVTLIDQVDGHPLGRLLVTAGEDCTVRLSSLTTGGPVRTLLTDIAPTTSLAVHRVGRQWIVAAVTQDGRLHRIDLDNGRPLGLPISVDRVRARVAAFDLGPTACVSVQGNARGLQIYDLVTGERVGGQVLEHAATALCRAGDTVCVGGSDGVVRLWPTPHAADSTHVTAHERQVLAVGEVRGPTGGSALVSVGQDWVIRCWDLARPHELWRRWLPVPELGPGVQAILPTSCAAVGHTSDGRDYVAVGEYAGRVRILVLRAGMPVAEQEFTVDDTLTKLTTGRIRDRDVLVAGTGTGRIVCWDVGAGRMYVHGPDPAEEVWATALALAPDGSGRLALGGLDGSVREWSLPACRPLGPGTVAHRGHVRALAYTAEGLVSGGVDGRLITHDDGCEQRLPQSVATLHPTQDGLLCGDDRGHIWWLREGLEGRRVVEALDAVRPVTAVAVVPADGQPGGLVVVAGSADGSLQAREAEHGTLVRRLRPVGEHAVTWLGAVSGSRPRLFARSEERLLQYWDFRQDGMLTSEGRPVFLPLNHERPEARPMVVPDPTGAQSLLLLAADWPRNDRVLVLDVDRGPLSHQPCSVGGEKRTYYDENPRAVHCGGRLIVLWALDAEVLGVLDTTTRRWAQLRVPSSWIIGAFALPGPEGEDLLLVSDVDAVTLPWNRLRDLFAARGERPRRFREVRFRGHSHWYGVSDSPGLRTEHPPAFYPDFCVLLPDRQRYVLGDRADLVVAHARSGAIQRRITLPSPCTALDTGPRGELIVGTGNGPILFDRLD